MRYGLRVFYLGKYEGFQRQPNKATIEGYLETALQQAGLIEDFKAAGYMAAGRTDKGVHALSQVIAINTSGRLIIPAINSFLPKNIIIWAVGHVNEKFHPRYDALSRYYRYYTNYSEEKLELMKEGAELLEGVHDFKLFSKAVPEKNTIRQIFQIRVEKKGALLIFHVIANSFLWQMIRRIVDSLLKIGQLQWELTDLKDLLEQSPKSSVFTVPRPVEGQGALILWDIEYPFRFKLDNKSLVCVEDILQEYLKEFSLKRQYFQEFFEFFEIVKNLEEE